jgi:hypothetical protein
MNSSAKYILEQEMGVGADQMLGWQMRSTTTGRYLSVAMEGTKSAHL